MKRIVVTNAVLFILLCFVSAVVAGEVTNLLANGDFSQRAKDFPVGWGRGGNRFSQQEGSSMAVVYDDAVPFADGMPVVKITQSSPPDAKGSFIFKSDPFPVEYGKTYKFSIWMKSDKPLTLSFSFDGGSEELARKLGKDYRHWFHRPAGVAQLDEQWRQYSLTTRIPLPSDSNYCLGMKSIWIRLEASGGNGTYWLSKANVVPAE